jgi:Domain of unknown function (DUF4190)
MTSPYLPPPVAPAPPRALSTTSLALGAGGLVFGWAFLGLPSIAAIVLGHLALRREPEGRSLATTGLVLGYVGVAAALGLGVLLVLSLLLPFAFLAVYPFVTPL